MLLQARDLGEWSDEPERFHAQADIGSWQEHPRSVAEALFRVLLQVSLAPVKAKPSLAHLLPLLLEFVWTMCGL